MAFWWRQRDIASDASENGLDGELIDKPKWVEGKFGMALEFDGQSSYVQIPAHENPNEAITVSAWVKSPNATWNQPGVLKTPPLYHSPNMHNKFCVASLNGGCWITRSWNDGNVGTDDITEWHMYTTTFDSIIQVNGTSILMPKKRVPWIWLKTLLTLIVDPSISDLMTVAAAHDLAQVLSTKS